MLPRPAILCQDYGKVPSLWKASVFDPVKARLCRQKVLNLKTQEIGLLICIWQNKFTDKTVDFATCVDKTGKRYNIELDNIRGFEDDFEK